MLTKALLAGVLLASAQALTAPAHADCESGIKRLQDTVGGMPDGRLKTLLGYDVKRALKESDEYDEGECAEALNHADGLLKTKP